MSSQDVEASAGPLPSNRVFVTLIGTGDMQGATFSNVEDTVSLPQDQSNFQSFPFCERIDLVCDAFEEAFCSQKTPQIEQFVEGLTEDEKSAAIPELVALECELLSHQGKRPSRADYCARFSAYLDGVESENLRDSWKDETRIEQALSATNTGQEAGWVSDSPIGSLGRRFGDYELIEEIARGGMGVVFKSRQLKANRIVALKMILSGKLASDAEVQRFHTEAEAAAKLDHPNIVPVYDVGELSGQHYFSMGYVEGRSLKDRLQRAGPLPSRTAAELLQPMAEAMAYAHQMGVIHRDIKPANILLDLDDRPKVTDFGLARQIESNSDLTVSGQIMGTPAYMAPEQAAGRTHDINQSADIYALGAVLFEMITGQAPFTGEGAYDVLRQVQEDAPQSPRQIIGTIDRDLETICLKCLEKHPGQRYASAASLALDLQRYLEGHPIHSRPVGRIERAWRWSQRNPLAAILTTLLTCSAIAMAGLAFVDEPRNESSKADLSVQVYLDGEIERLVDVSTTPASLRLGDSVRIHANIAEPRYAYLFWVSGNGEVGLIYPTDMTEQKAVQRIDLPSEKGQGFPIQGETGTEIAVLIVAPQPLDVDELKKSLRPLSPIPVLGTHTVIHNGATIPIQMKALDASDAVDQHFATRSLGTSRPLKSTQSVEEVLSWHRHVKQRMPEGAELNYIALPYISENGQPYEKH